MNAIVVDTSFLISLIDPNRPHHETAKSYLREALARGVPMYLSAIVASEFQVKQAVTDLPLRNFIVLPFNIDHAMTAGMLMRELHRDTDDKREVVKEDVKLIAQAICESATHVLTEDRRTLAQYLQRFREAGQTSVQAVLLAEHFELAWFTDGQRGLLDE